MLRHLFFPHERASGHIPALDGLRGLAVLIVLLAHASNEDFLLLPFLNFSHLGKTGVYLFFVLSAFLLDRQIALALRNGRANLRFWLNYFMRRILRIYPLFCIALLVYAYGHHLTGIHTAIQAADDIWAHLLLQRGKMVFWSIPPEFGYYFLSPVIMYGCHLVLGWNRRYLLSLFILMIAVSALFPFVHPLSLTSTFRYLVLFLTGTAIAVWWVLRPSQLNIGTTPDWAAVLGATLIMTSGTYFSERLFGSALHIHHPEYYLPYALLWGMVLIAVLWGKGLINQVLSSIILRFLGSISFSAYLFHMPVLLWVRKYQMAIPQGVHVYIFLFFTLIVSTISYLLIERPLSRVRLS